MPRVKWNNAPDPQWKKQRTLALIFLFFSIYWWLVLAVSIEIQAVLILWLFSLGWTSLSLSFAYLSWKNYTPTGKCANCRQSKSSSVILDAGLQGVSICRRCVAVLADEISQFDSESSSAVKSEPDNPFQTPFSLATTVHCDFCSVADQPQIQFGNARQFAICESCIARFKKRGEVN